MQLSGSVRGTERSQAIKQEEPVRNTLFLKGEVISRITLVSYSRNRGHGTYMGEEKLIASVAGSVERVNKLICVKALKTR